MLTSATPASTREALVDGGHFAYTGPLPTAAGSGTDSGRE